MQRWTEHTAFTDPGGFSAELSRFGPSLHSAVEAVQRVLIHGGAVEHYGLVGPDNFSRDTLTVEARLADVRSRWAGAMVTPRPASARSIGTCRDYALLLCAAMRSHGTPARVRCGFASYLGGAPWEDHWLCEVWIDTVWRKADAQLDLVHRKFLGVEFHPEDVPPEAFLTSDEAWRRVRFGEFDEDAFGHGDARGLWFAFVNLVRDQLALADCLTSDWDSWRLVSPEMQGMSATTITIGDRLARDVTENEPPTIHPWWLPS